MRTTSSLGESPTTTQDMDVESTDGSQDGSQKGVHGWGMVDARMVNARHCFDSAPATHFWSDKILCCFTHLLSAPFAGQPEH